MQLRASVGKLIEWDMGRSVVTNELQWSPGAELGHLTHGPDTIEIPIRHSKSNWDRITLTTTDWVRVTVPASGARRGMKFGDWSAIRGDQGNLGHSNRRE